MKLMIAECGAFWDERHIGRTRIWPHEEAKVAHRLGWEIHCGKLWFVIAKVQTFERFA
jgi:hypothetical protein